MSMIVIVRMQIIMEQALIHWLRASKMVHQVRA
jgi:hypothetical protein